jgi:hypothetical protein
LTKVESTNWEWEEYDPKLGDGYGVICPHCAWHHYYRTTAGYRHRIEQGCPHYHRVELVTVSGVSESHFKSKWGSYYKPKMEHSSDDWVDDLFDHVFPEAKKRRTALRTLELPSNATPDEIRSKYRVLAAQLHPDHGGDGEAFRHVAEAYATLTR